MVLRALPRPDAFIAAVGAFTPQMLELSPELCRHVAQHGRIVVDSRHFRIHAKDCAECETATGMVDRIERDITLIGPLDADQRAKLLDIADRCPVHRTLRSEVSIHTAEAPTDQDKG